VVVKRFSADSERLNVRIDERALGALCASLIGRSLTHPLEFRPIIQAGEAVQRRWLSLMRVLLDYAVTPPAAGISERLLKNLEEMAMLMLLTEHQHSYSDVLSCPSPGPAPRHVRAAEEFIRANAAEPLTLAGIAGAAGVGIRTLTAGFQSFRQTSPMAYLREVRLSLARQDLLDGASTATVADIALRWGFGNFGRFAAEYCRRFGEYPSDTLRQRR
jgi:AraC-like DNA-binding protein